MTSEAIEESAVNVFMCALALGSGTAARWRFESNPAGANEPSGIRQLKPGRRTAERPRLLFLYDVVSAMRERAAASILPECVREASPLNRAKPSTLS
jgi:hypothetical protein